MMKIINGPEVTAQLSAALKDIARMTGFSEKEVTKGEAGQILKTWAGRTKVAKPGETDLRTRRRVLHKLGLTAAGQGSASIGNVTINTGSRGVAGLLWVKTNGRSGTGKPFKLAGVQGFQGSPFTATNRHWTNAVWSNIQDANSRSSAALQRAMPLARASVGLARQSVIQIADMAGIKLESIPGGGISPAGIAKARKALASNGQYYQNGTAQEQQQTDAGKYFITLINSLPFHAKAGMDATLAGVIAGRTGLYRRNFQNGAYKGIQSAARNYPWMRVQLQAA
jgi:hypothetical protein